MSRYIDADVLYEAFENAAWRDNYDRDNVAEDILLDAPTVNAVPVVRCGECKHWANGFTNQRPCHKTDAYPMTADDFCSYGERKEPTNE